MNYFDNLPGWTTTTMQSPLTTDRGKLRMEKLRQLELEQLQWEQEALVMPEDLDRALFLSFESVKTEFSDLDGLSWSRYPVPLVTNPWALEEPTPKLACAEIETPPDSCDAPTPVHSPTFPTFSHHHSPRRPSKPPLPPRTVEDTIRASRLAQPSRSPLQPANQLFPPQSQLAHAPGPLARSHAPANMALACHTLRHSTYGR